MVLSLWTVPLVLRALGQSDYGLYNLVAGVVTMLTFLNSSMTVVTQRYMSVTMGSGNQESLNHVYNASIRIHFILGIVLVLLLEICTPFLFNGFLNIETGRNGAALVLYQFMIVSTFFTIIAVPFDATLNAYENMLVFSLISSAEAIFRLLLAYTLAFFSIDRLIVYGLGLASISILGVLARVFIVGKKYSALRFRYNESIPKDLYKEMLSYAGWNTFGSVAMVGKNQGIAVVLNLFKGTVINASYGIANQVNGLLSSFTSSIQKAVSPQLMKHEGANQHEEMINMSFSLVKMATIVFSLMAIPIALEAEQLLQWWLHDDVPAYTVIFCQLIILTQLLFQLSSGVALTIDAVGKIKIYRIVLSAVLVLNIPIAYFFLKLGYEPYMVIATMVLIEFLCLLVRLYFAYQVANYPILLYFTECLLPLFGMVCFSLLGGYLITLYIHPGLVRLIIVTATSILLTSITSLLFVLNKKEKQLMKNFCNSIIYKVSRR